MARDVLIRIVLQNGQTVRSTLDVTNRLLESILGNASGLSKELQDGFSTLASRIGPNLKIPLNEVNLSFKELAEGKKTVDAAFNSAGTQDARNEFERLSDTLRLLNVELQGTNASSLNIVKSQIEGLLQQPIQQAEVSILQLAEAKRILDREFARSTTAEARSEIAEMQRVVAGLDAGIRELAGGDLVRVKERIETLLQQPLQEVDITMRELAETKRVLDAALLSASSTEARAGIVRLQVQVKLLEADLRKTAAAAANLDTLPNAGLSAKSLNKLGQAAFQVGQIFEDSLAAGARGAANNVNFLLAQVAPFGGVFGIVAATIASIGISVGTATGFFDDLFATLFNGAESIDEVKTKLQSLVDFDFDLGVTINEGNIEEVTRKTEALVNERQRLFDETKSALDELQEQAQSGNFVSAQQAIEDAAEGTNEALFAQRDAQRDLLKAREQSLNDAKAELELVKEQRAEIDAQIRRRRDLVASGAITQEELEAEEEAERKREENARKLERLRKQLAQQLTQTRLSLIEDEEEKRIQAIRNEFAERIALANQVDDSQAAVELEEALSARIQQVREEFRDKELQAERDFNQQLARVREQQEVADGALESTVISARIASLNQLLSAEEVSIEDRRRLRILLAQSELELTNALARESSEQIKIADRTASAALRFSQQFQQARENLLQAQGVPLLEILQARESAIASELESTQNNVDRIRELQLELLSTQAEILSEEQRLLQERAQVINGFLTNVADSIENAVNFEPDITDQDINEQRRLFAEAERELEQSLKNRELTQAQYVQRSNALDKERLDFFKQVQEEQISVAARASAAILGFLAQETRKYILLRFSEAIADNIKLAAGKVPFPAILGVGAAIFAGLKVLQNRLLNETGFLKGGYTGDGAHTSEAGVVHRREYVFDHRATSGQVKELDALRVMMQKGVKLSDILGAYSSEPQIMGLRVTKERRPIDRLPVPGGHIDAAYLVPTLKQVAKAEAVHANEAVKTNRLLSEMKREMKGLRDAIGTYSDEAFNDSFEKPRLYNNISRMAGQMDKAVEQMRRRK